MTYGLQHQAKQETVDRAIGAALAGCYSFCLSILEEAFSNPTHIEPRALSFYGLGLALVRKQYGPAADHCRRAILMDPEFREHYVNLTKVLLAAGLRKDAVDILREGLKALPNEPTLLRLHEELGIRFEPPIPFLGRSHRLNIALGRRRHERRQRLKQDRLRALREQGLSHAERCFDTLGLVIEASGTDIEEKYQELHYYLSLDPAFEARLHLIDRAYSLLRAFHHGKTGNDDTAAAKVAKPAAWKAHDPDSVLDSTATRDPLRHYLKVLGLPPEASLDQVSAAFARLWRRCLAPATQQEEDRREQIRRAYSIVLRVLRARRRAQKLEARPKVSRALMRHEDPRAKLI